MTPLTTPNFLSNKPQGTPRNRAKKEYFRLCALASILALLLWTRATTQYSDLIKTSNDEHTASKNEKSAKKGKGSVRFGSAGFFLDSVRPKLRPNLRPNYSAEPRFGRSLGEISATFRKCRILMSWAWMRRVKLVLPSGNAGSWYLGLVRRVKLVLPSGNEGS